MMSFELQRRVDWLVETIVSEELAVSICRAEVIAFSHKDADSTVFRNAGFYQPVHTGI
jgi:hypothetical protein